MLHRQIPSRGLAECMKQAQEVQRDTTLILE